MPPLQSSCGCTCSAGPKLIFSCSGAADVGELADQTARKLTRNGDGKMFCLAGIGGRVPNDGAPQKFCGTTSYSANV